MSLESLLLLRGEDHLTGCEARFWSVRSRSHFAFFVLSYDFVLFQDQLTDDLDEFALNVESRSLEVVSALGILCMESKHLQLGLDLEYPAGPMALQFASRVQTCQDESPRSQGDLVLGIVLRPQKLGHLRP